MRNIIIATLLPAALALPLTAIAAPAVPATLILPMVKTAPAMDGTLNDPVWKKAQVLELSEKAMPLRPAIPGAKTALLLLAGEDNNLYLGFDCSFPPEYPPKGQKREHDASVFEDECVEIFIGPDGRPNTENYYHFAVNVQGSATERKGLDPAWNVDWGRVVRIDKDRWTATLTVPLAPLVDGDASGHYWRIGACRDVYAANGSFVQGMMLTRPGYYHPGVAVIVGPVKARTLLAAVDEALAEVDAPTRPLLRGAMKRQNERLMEFRATLSASLDAAIGAKEAVAILDTALANAGKRNDMVIWNAMFE